MIKGYTLVLFGVLYVQAVSTADNTAASISNALNGEKGITQKVSPQNFTSIKKESPSIVEINMKADTNHTLSQGDIILTTEQKQAKQAIRSKRGAPTSDKRYLWDKNSYIPYSFAHDLPSKAIRAIKAALDFWQSHTCLRFMENAYGQNSIRFINGSGCYSYFGRIFNQAVQNISIGIGCETVGKAAHEIAHALGFQHTHVRHDRDDYVTVNMHNVPKDDYENFEKSSITENNNYGLPYEYGSVMHYDGYALAVNEKIPTIVAHNINYEDTMGNRRLPTFNDVLMMNTHYQCLDRCAHSSTQCYNGGYPHVNDCSKCLCPSGFAGLYCEKRPNAKKCGQSVIPSSQWRVLRGVAGDGRRVENSNFDECVFWIRSLRGKSLKVQIQLVKIYGVCAKACAYGGVEIKAEENKKLTGYTFCCEESDGRTFTAVGPVIPIIVYNKFFYNGFQLRYRLVQ